MFELSRCIDRNSNQLLENQVFHTFLWYSIWDVRNTYPSFPLQRTCFWCQRFMCMVISELHTWDPWHQTNTKFNLVFTNSSGTYQSLFLILWSKKKKYVDWAQPTTANSLCSILTTLLPNSCITNPTTWTSSTFITCVTFLLKWSFIISLLFLQCNSFNWGLVRFSDCTS